MRRLLTVGGVLALITPFATAANAAPGVQTHGSPVVVNSKPSGHRCAAVTKRSIRGTIQGQDGLGVKTQIGFDLVDSSGRKIDLATGCPLGAAYSAWATLNSGLRTDGAAFTGSVANTFELENLPANATHVYAESYPRGPNSPLHYGHALRRFTPIAKGTTTLDMTVPTTAAFGGNTGTLVLKGSGISFIYVRSDAKDGTRLLGWGDANPRNGVATIAGLASNQTYTATISYTSGRTVVKDGFKVNPDRTTTATL